MQPIWGQLHLDLSFLFLFLFINKTQNDDY